MDLPKSDMFTYLFSTYRKTTGIAFAAILIIAIPVTLGLLGQQQDLRQRAAEVANPHPACGTDADCQVGFACMGSAGEESGVSTCQPRDTQTTSCNTDADCAAGSSCDTVSTTGSTPGSEQRQCVFHTNSTASSNIFDLNDDGIVNFKDLNILYAGFSSRQGD